MRKMVSIKVMQVEQGLEVRTIGDSRGYLWKIIIDNNRGIGKIEKVSGLSDSTSLISVSVDGSEYPLPCSSSVRDAMQILTGIIESRFQAA